MSWILGISAYYHDSAAALIYQGKIIAAAQEERFSRKKNDSSFPTKAIKYVLQEAGIKLEDIDLIVFYDKPFLKFERLLETYHAFAPRGLRSFLKALPVWVKEKLFQKKMIKAELKKIGKITGKLLFSEHHLSHAASAFFPSPFQEAAILTLDGVGEWSTASIAYGNENNITVIKELHFPHSLGLLYSAFTYYCGFKVNSGEYKLMGLAPYGDSSSKRTVEFIEKIKSTLVDIREDGSILLNMHYFGFATGLKMTVDKKWQKLFGVSPRKPESDINQVYMDLAFAIQKETEEIILKLATTVKDITKSENLVLAGGVALNSVANGKLLELGIFKNIWVQPAAGDAGGALGAALSGWYIYLNNTRTINGEDYMQGALLGPSFSNSDIEKFLRKQQQDFEYFQDFEELCDVVAEYINQGKVVGWFQGRMEFGPRALGNRSILADARNPEMQKKLNLKIKKREGFRPFAPAVLEEDAAKYFQLKSKSPYMLFVVPVNEERRNNNQPLPSEENMKERLYFNRSDIPAVTHIDFSARVQTVSKNVNPRFWNLINTFKNKTGYGVVINTSFNVRGEPIICSPEDAFNCFNLTEMDVLVMENVLVRKK